MLLHHHDIDEFTATPACDFLTGCNIISNLLPFSETPYAPMTLLPNMPVPGEEIIPPVTWRRSILFVKDRDPLGPNYFAIRDSFDGATRPTDWSCWCLATDVRFEGNVARFTGQYGVDMDVAVFSPARAEFVQNRDPIPPPPTVCTAGCNSTTTCPGGTCFGDDGSGGICVPYSTADSRFCPAGQRVLEVTGFMMIAEACVDLAITVDFVRANGVHAAWIAGSSSLLSIAVLGFTAVVAGGSVPAADEVPARVAASGPASSPAVEPEDVQAAFGVGDLRPIRRGAGSHP